MQYSVVLCSVVYCSCNCNWNCHKTLTFCSLLARFKLICACIENDIWTSKRAANPSVYFPLLTWKSASLDSGVHFFDISTSKSGPRRSVLMRFCLGDVLRAATPCTFLASQLPKVVREWCFVHFDLEMCFAPQPRAILDLSSGQMALHPPL